jgi:hypothetical protein
MVELNHFEHLIKGLPEKEGWKKHVLAVADTMFLCRAWFEAYHSNYTASDIVAMAALILHREETPEQEDFRGRIGDIADSIEAINASIDLVVGGRTGGETGYVRIYNIGD